MTVIYDAVKPVFPETPVRYPPEHKIETRKRIVQSARKLWKAKGYANVTINEIMKDAGLTHGGFYAHFKSKDDLFAEAAFDVEVLERYRTLAADPAVPPLAVFEAVLDYYLSAAHRDNPAEGCPLVALSDDAWRLGEEVQSAYARLTDVAVQQLQEVLKDRVLTHTVLAAMTGAVQLARGVGEEKRSLEILEDTKRTLIALVTERLG